MAGRFIDVPGHLAPYAPLPADATVVLARSRFHASPYASEQTRDGWHIVNWLLPTVGLCDAELVPVEDRAYGGRPVPAPLGGRDDARYARPGESTCRGCRSAYGRSVREMLPHDAQSRMEERDRAERAERAAEREERREAAAAARGEQLALADDLADQVAGDDNRVSGSDLRAGDVCAPGSFGIRSSKTIRIVASPRPLDAVGMIPRVEVAYQVGDGPVVRGALMVISRIKVLERGPRPGSPANPVAGEQLALFG